MSIELVTIILFGGMALLLFFGVPAAFAIGGLSVILTLWLWGTKGLYTVATTTYGQITSVTLLAIPMFVLMANLLVHSGIADRLFQALSYWLSGIRGSLALVSVGVCTALAMCGGFGPGIITMSLIAIPAMLKRSYDRSLALGSVIAGGVLGDLIPPSIIMIVFAFITRLSIGQLFMAGVIPGFMLAFLHMLSILIRCRFNPKLAPRVAEDVTWKMRWVSLRAVVLPAALIIIVLGTIFLGIATPTEAAGVGAFGALLCCVINRSISRKMVTESCLETIKITGMVIWILIAATLFGVFYTSVGARDLMLDLVLALPVSPYIVLIGMQVILLILGMFMDDFAIVIICAPIFFPIAVSLGFDPIWFAIVFIINMEIAYLTPPFGWALIMVKGVAPPEITTADVWRSAPPFLANMFLILIAVIVFPQLALWLPSIM